MKLNTETEKLEALESIEAFIKNEGFNIINKDFDRPWGGFLVIDESQAPEFIKKYFSHLSLEDFSGFEKLSPKILIVAPNKRLSWQYHHRRAEIWKLIAGTAGVVVSDTDKENIPLPLQVGQVINLKCGERHRLLGSSGYGVIAEIWQHTDKENPSDESDIVRVQDDFGR